MIRCVKLFDRDKIILVSLPVRDYDLKLLNYEYVDEILFDRIYDNLVWSDLNDVHRDLLIKLSYFLFGRDNFYRYMRLFYSN